MPAVVSSSDAGAGIGYTYMSVRGSNGERINVTVNGIPYNDAESHGTFWVNLGDFASSTQNLQLQRGVGTSTNGSGAFGASLNILTDGIAEEAYGELSNSFGSFNTQKKHPKIQYRKTKSFNKWSKHRNCRTLVNNCFRWLCRQSLSRFKILLFTSQLYR